MGNESPPPLPESTLVEEKFGMKLYALKKTLLFSYEPKIKLMAVGAENELETKSIILLGATGAGKTCLINALVNHLLDVHFEDGYRYILKDETGDKPKSMAESQTDYVVGYLIYVSPGSKWQYNFLIIDTPGFNDSRGEEQDQEVTNQIRTFLKDVDGVDELNFIGFVVNGTIARLQPQFRDIVEAFCEVFGKNAEDIIQILVSFGHMRKPPVIDVLEASCLKDYKRSIFDNCALIACSQANEECSEEEVNMYKLFWTGTAKVYDSLLKEISNSEALSLSMTRETLEDIKDLNECFDVMKVSVDCYLDSFLELKQCENECSELMTVIKANEDFEGTIDVKVRTVQKHLDRKSRAIKHSHNCERCLQTCKYPCDFRRKHCPRGDEQCSRCPCPNNSHVKSDDIISHYIEKRPIVHEDKKKSYDDAKAKESVLLESMTKQNEEIDSKRNVVEGHLQEINKMSEKIKLNSLGKTHPSAPHYIHSVLEKVKLERLGETSESQELQGHVVSILNDISQHLKAFVGLEDQ